MKYFFDTEFIEHKGGIDLISIGIVCEDGRQLYLISSEWKYENADRWVRENVILPCYLDTVVPRLRGEFSEKNFHQTLGTRNNEIARLIIKFVGEDNEPQFFAYFADYDWVIFARLFGRMIDLPEHFPMWCVDLKQMMWERGLSSSWKSEELPANEEHNALVDAKWNQALYNKIMAYKK